MATMRVGDIDLEYYVEGSGPTLLMVMGMGGQASSWSRTFLDLLQKRFTTVRFSNRGTGRSGQSQEVTTIRNMAEDAAGLLKALAIERTHVFGISMGGMISQELVLNYPQMMQGLVLGCTMCGQAHSLPIPPETVARAASIQSLPSREEKAKTFWSMAVSPEFERDHADFLDEIVKVEMESPTPEETMLRQIGATMTFDTYDRLPQVKAPTLIIQGTVDVLVVPGNADILRDRIAGSQVHMIEGVGHCFFWERPEEVTTVISEFLAAVPAPA
jgi:pimeloyl-ACP methyl ester carboxylesterase